MANDLDKAVKAFKNAVAAGDEEAAGKIAKAIKQMQSNTSAIPEREKVSHTGGLSGQATQGALFGFGDEYLAGLSALAGVQPDGAGGANWFQYDKPLAERYSTALGAIRGELNEYREENPKKSIAANIAGGVATAGVTATGMGLKAAQTGVGKAAQITAGGAGAGFVEGFGSGEGGPVNRLVSGGIGAGVGAVFAPVVGFGISKIAQFAQQKGGSALRAVFANRKMFDRQTGELTDAGRKRLARLGYDANELSKEMQNAFGVAATQARDAGVDGSEAVGRMAAANRFDVPLTAGQATNNVPQVAFEEAARAGARGNKAYGVMSGFDEMQSRAVSEARDRVGVSVGSEAVDRVDAADAVISGVRREAEAARQAGKQAYNVLEEMGAAVTGATVKGLDDRISNQVRASGFDITNDAPNANAAISYLKNKLGGFADDATVPFMEIERARQGLVRVNNAAKRGANGADQAAMESVMDAFDGWVDDTITAALANGDDAAIAQVKNARSLWAKYRQTFLSKEGADNFIKKIVQDDISPDQVAGWLYGAATTPGGGQTSLVARRIKNILGEDSAEWGMVKRAAWDHITKGGAQEGIGPQAVVGNLTKFLDGKGKALSRELFTDEQLKQIAEFRNMMKVLVPPKKATNPSGSGYEIQRSMVDLFGMLVGGQAGPLGAAAGREITSGSSDFVSGLAAKAAAKGIVPPGASASVAVGSGVSAGAAAQEEYLR